MSTHHSEDHTSTGDTFESLYERCLEDLYTRLEHTTTLMAEAFQTAAHAVRESLSASMGDRQEDLQQVIEALVRQWQQVIDYYPLARPGARYSDTKGGWTEQGMSVLAQLAGRIKTLAGEAESRLRKQL